MKYCSTSSMIYQQMILEEMKERIRDNKELNQKTLSHEIGVSQEYLSKMLNGKTRMQDYIYSYLLIRLDMLKGVR